MPLGMTMLPTRATTYPTKLYAGHWKAPLSCWQGESRRPPPKISTLPLAASQNLKVPHALWTQGLKKLD